VEDEVEEEKTRIVTNYEDQLQQNKPANLSRKKLYTTAGVVLIIILALSIYLFTGKNNGEQEQDNHKEVKVKYSSLLVNSEPSGAVVYLNGNPRDVTPCTIDSLTAGRYSIVLKRKGYNDWDNTDYKLDTGRNNLNITLKQIVVKKAEAHLTLNSVPAANIYIDGKKVLSNSNETIRNLVTAGEHRIKFVHPKFGTKEISVNLSKNQDKELTCYFQQQVNIQSLSNTGDPIWGMIYLNGKNTDKTTPGDLNLGPGNYKITVKKTGYRTVEDDVPLTISPTFEPKTHTLVFHFR
jgi:hypothetical protein